MGFLSSLLSGLKGGLDQGIMKTLPNAGMDQGMVRGLMPVQPGQMPESVNQPSTMLGALLQKNPDGQRSILGNLGGILKNPEALNYIGAALKDMSGDDGNLMAAEQNVMARQEKAKKDALALQSRQAISEAMKGAYGESGKFDPMLFAQNMLGSGSLTDAGDVLSFAKEAMPQPIKPQYVEGPDGIYEIVGGQSKRIQDYPQKPMTTPGQVNPATGRWEWAPGYLEGQGQLSSVRRAPPRPRAATGQSSGSGAVPPPPPGFRIVRP